MAEHLGQHAGVMLQICVDDYEHLATCSRQPVEHRGREPRVVEATHDSQGRVLGRKGFSDLPSAIGAVVIGNDDLVREYTKGRM